MATYNTGNGHSLSELEQQAETSRAELAMTVEELQSRVSPRALKRDARDYVRNTSQQFVQTVEARARENPMAAVAIAAGLALPLWRVVSNLPAPLLLIGAGLAMSQRRGTWSGEPGYIARSGESLVDTLTAKAEDAKAKAAEMGTHLSQAVGDSVENMRRAANDATDRVSETAAEASRMAGDALERGRSGMMDVIERHPLLVGGAALVAGGIVASALPVTRQERRVLGRASDDVRARGQDIAGQGLEAATNAAMDIYEDVSAQVRAEGLTPDTARSAVRQTMERAGTVIEKAAAAVDDPKPKSGRQKHV